MSTEANAARLQRELGLKEATALNMIDMVGIGPFITIYIVVGLMAGPQSIVAWAAGALLAMVDGCVWAELGAAMPQAGGSYVFLRESYGPRWGRLMSFLFIWQTMFQAPLVMASAAIGFTEYVAYYWPLGPVADRAIRAAVILLVVVLLYRRIGAIGKISVLLWTGVVATMVMLIAGGIMHFDAKLAFTYPEGAWNLSWPFFTMLGAATVKTLYTYLGYYNVCHLGGEIREPERNIPRSIFISIAGIAVLYLAMQVSILGVIPWREAAATKYIVSVFVERTWGAAAANVATIMILWIAFGSLFALTLGYSRIPYAAAVDGAFFSVFSRVHPTRHFPHVSLLVLGGVGLLFSLLFRLSEVISAIIAMRALVQFVGGAVGLMVLRRRWPSEKFPFKMWLYPAPVLVSIAGWLLIFASTGTIAVRQWQVPLWLAGITMSLLGALVFLLRARQRGEWPYERGIETANERR